MEGSVVNHVHTSTGGLGPASSECCTNFAGTMVCIVGSAERTLGAPPACVALCAPRNRALRAVVAVFILNLLRTLSALLSLLPVNG